MAQLARYALTSLVGTNKAGLLIPDEAGYRTVVVGALNMYNESGEFYTADKTKALFDGSSDFKRRIERGALRGEVDHPDILPGQTEDEFLNRLFTIDPKNTCCHFRSIWLEPGLGQGGCIPVLADVKPSGVHERMLENQFGNPNENVCFSVRGFTEDTMIRGRVERSLRMIVTYDYVNEPGIPIAEKWQAPGLEKRRPGINIHHTSGERRDRIFVPETFRELASKRNEYAMECLKMSTEAIANFGWEAPKNTFVTMSNWIPPKKCR